MPELDSQKKVARQVERIVRKLTSLSTLPVVAADLLKQLNSGHVDSAILAERIESDPALAAKVMALAHQERVAFTGEPTLTEAISKLPAAVLREAVVSVKVFEVLDDAGNAGSKRAFSRKQMALHSLAVGCCAGQIAEKVLEPGQRQTAYLAGLLHDIGKCALDEVMPKSFAKIVEQAQNSQVGLSEVEQSHLGLDHAVLGKRLGQQWALPEAVVSAIWLHHCDGQTLATDLPHVQIARIVALADCIVRQLGLGHSGSFNQPEDIEELSRLLALTPQQLAEIADGLMKEVEAKQKLLGFEASEDPSYYYAMVRKTATELSQDNRKLNTTSKNYSRLSGQADLIDDFLNEVDENSSALDIAQALAGCWQKHCKTGLTGVYVVPDSTEPYVEMAAVNRRGSNEVKTLEVPDMMPPIPEVFRRQTALLPIADAAKWLSEQLEADFNPRLLKMMPLKMGDEVVGVVFFETFAEDDAPQEQGLLLSCKVAAAAIAMAQASHKHELLSERFVQVMSTLRQMRVELAKQQSLAGLAEMAAGAAHELNNPLSVISGRSQLLLDSETDEDKKQMLRQIQSRTDEMSQIVSDLLAFARPPQPNKQSISVAELLDKAIEKTCRQCELSSMELEIAGDQKEACVYVDVHQIGLSLSCILTNALQSYKGENGPVWVNCCLSPDGKSVCIAIRDTGCGMDAQTAAKATDPFFSSCQAGRRRGMGLANALRLVSLNGGDIKLSSQPDQGTTVTVTLPKV